MAFLFLVLTIFVMFFQPASIFPDIQAYQPLRNLAIIALLLYLITGKKSEQKFFSNKENIYFLFFVFFQILSASKIWITGGIVTFNLWLRLGLVYFLIVKSVNTPKRISAIIYSIVFAILYLSYFSIDKYVINYQPGIRAGGFGWYTNSNDLSNILVSVIPLSLFLAEKQEKIILRYFFLLISGIFSFNMLFTGSRGGLIALGIVGYLSIKSSKRFSKTFKMILYSVLIISVMGMGIKNVLSRSDLNELSGDESSEDRITQWRAGVIMLIKNPILGVGPGEFSSRSEEFGGIRGLQPHNTIVQVFSETGLPGGIFFILLTINPIFEGMKLIRKKQYLYDDKIIYLKYIIIALIGFWVSAFFGNRYREYILYVLLALFVAYKRIFHSEFNEDINNET